MTTIPRLWTTADPTVLLAEARSKPGHRYIIREFGTPWLWCNCPAIKECIHVVTALHYMLQCAQTGAQEETMSQPQPDDDDAQPTPLALVPVQPGGGLVGRHDMQQRAALMRRQAAESAGSYRELFPLAKVMVESKLVPATMSSSQAAIVMMKALELGVPVVSAFEYLYVVNGKVALQSQMVLALVQRSGLGKIEIVETTAERCTAVGTRDGYSPLVVTFTVADAQRAGLTSGRNAEVWKRYPADMLRHKATARVGRAMFADLLSGMDVADGSNGMVIDSVATHLDDDAPGQALPAGNPPPANVDRDTGEFIDPPPASHGTPVDEGEYREVPATPPPAAETSPDAMFLPPASSYAWWPALGDDAAEAGVDAGWVLTVAGAPLHAAPGEDEDHCLLRQLAAIQAWLDAAPDRSPASLIQAASAAQDGKDHPR